MRRYSVTYEMQLTHNTPDGIMIYGPHAQTAEENREETTISSIYIIENNKDICIIDTGRFESRYKTIKKIIEDGRYNLRYIILTHDHYDHIGNTDILKKEFGGIIYAHKLDSLLIKNPLNLYENEKIENEYGYSIYTSWEDIGFNKEDIDNMKNLTKKYFYESSNVDVYIEEDTELDLSGIKIRLLHTPGHSPGSISVYVEKTGSIYTGDLTFWINPCRPYPVGNIDSCLKSLSRIQKMDIKYCGQGHYLGILSPKNWIQSLLCKYKKMENDILECTSKKKNISEIRRIIFQKNPFDSFFPIPENSIQANLVSLMQRNKIIRISEDDGIYWINPKKYRRKTC